MTRTFYRQMTAALPDRYEPSSPAEHETLPQIAGDLFSSAISLGVVAEFGPEAMPVVEMVLTCHIEQIDMVPFPPDCDDHDCRTCQAPRDFAKTYLAAYPGKHVALALITIDVP